MTSDVLTNKVLELTSVTTHALSTRETLSHHGYAQHQIVVAHDGDDLTAGVIRIRGLAEQDGMFCALSQDLEAVNLATQRNQVLFFQGHFEALSFEITTPLNEARNVTITLTSSHVLKVNSVVPSVGGGRMPGSEFFFDVARGLVHGMTAGAKFGRISDVDIGTPEDVWEGQGDYTGHPESFTPELVQINSASANDTAAGTGARTVRIYGLKTSSSTEYESEDITLNGTSWVNSTNTWWRINRCIVLTAGSTGGNEGGLTCRGVTTNSAIFFVMQIGMNQTQVAAFTVPASKTLYIRYLRVSMERASGAAGSALVTVRAREPGGVYRAVRAFDITHSNGVDKYAMGWISFPAGTDIKFRVDSVSDNNTAVEATMEYILVDA